MDLIKWLSLSVGVFFAAERVFGGDYLVVDLSGGTNAASFPVTHIDSVPTGGWTEEYKTSKIVLRKITAGSFVMGSPSNELGRVANVQERDETQHRVTLTKDYFVGVFEVTQRQWELVMGNNPSDYAQLANHGTLPIEAVSYGDIRGASAGAGWPISSAVDAASFMGRLRSKTGFGGFDLPTEAQWEYACRAGTTTALNSGKNLTGTERCTNLSELARYYYTGGNAYFGVKTAAVGSYLPNSWGLYDMHGNVWECCLDWYGMYPGESVDPRGALSGTYRCERGGCWGDRPDYCRSAFRGFDYPSHPFYYVGFRLAFNLITNGVAVVGGSGGGDHVVGEMFTVSADIPAPGYMFAGWTVLPEGINLGALFCSSNSTTTVIMPGNAFTLTAVFRPETYDVAFDAAGGGVEPMSKTVTYASTYGALPTPSRLGFAFGGWWTGENGTGSQVTETTVVEVTTDHVLYALWTKAGYICPGAEDAVLSTDAAYDGYFYSDSVFSNGVASAVRGTLSVRASALTGKLTAKAKTQRATFNFSAAAWTATDADGTLRTVMKTRGGETLELCVRQNRIWGALAGGSLGNETFAVDGARDCFSDRKDVASQTLLDGFRGYYTVALPVYGTLPSDVTNAVPGGCGYLTVTIGVGGSAKIAGLLADGTKVSQSSRLILFNGCGPEACVPLFAPLYAGAGWVGGLIWIDPSSRTIVTDRDLGWWIRWGKDDSEADGFDLLLDACGGFYDSARSLDTHYRFSAYPTDVSYYYGGRNVDIQPVFPSRVGVTMNGSRVTIAKGVRPVFVGGAYNYAVSENSSMATMLFSPSTGIFKGSFNLYYDFVLSGKPQHKIVNVPYAGILTPVRGSVFAELPAGLGAYQVKDKNPALLPYSPIRSCPVILEAVP